jgi:hypothetical protein
MNYFCKIWLITLCLMIFPLQLYAQAEDIRPAASFGINAGYGIFGGKDMSGLGFLANAHYDSPIGLIGARFIHASDTNVHAGFASYISEISELSLLYGYSYNFGLINLAASTGIGTTWGEEIQNGSRENFSTFAIPLQGSVIFQPLPIAGFGVQVSKNINSVSRVTGVLFVLQIGRLY